MLEKPYATEHEAIDRRDRPGVLEGGKALSGARSELHLYGRTDLDDHSMQWHHEQPTCPGMDVYADLYATTTMW